MSSPSLRPSGTDAPLRIGLVGLGRWGMNYLRTLRQLPECRLVGIAEPEPVRNPVDDDLPPVFPDVEELLNRTEPNAVVIATPDRTHAALADICLSAGCNLLVEKPLALSAGDAERICLRAETKSLILAVGQTTLYHPGYQRLQTGLAGRAAGRLLYARSIRSSTGIPGSDLLWDLAPHTIALAVGLFGTPSSVASTGKEDRVEFTMTFPDISFEACIEWTPAPARRKLIIQGDSGTLEFDETLPVTPLPLTILCREFIHSCRTGKRPIADGRFGLQVVTLIEALRNSARANGIHVSTEETAACR